VVDEQELEDGALRLDGGTESVRTTMPSVTGVAQAGSSLREPSTSTRHIRHAATESMPGW